MDYFNEAFGGFDPRSDKDASLKLALDSLLADDRADDILHLVLEDNQIGGVEGEPGWIVECRRNGEVEGYETWPENASFRAYVDPEAYSLTYPEFFSDRKAFLQYVSSIISVYLNRNPSQGNIVRRILQVIEED